jgi:hypothetical protein
MNETFRLAQHAAHWSELSLGKFSGEMCGDVL